jgi:hypothetical protein
LLGSDSSPTLFVHGLPPAQWDRSVLAAMQEAGLAR